MAFTRDPEYDSLPLSQREMKETFLNTILNGKKYIKMTKEKIMAYQYTGKDFQYITPLRKEATCWQNGWLASPFPIEKEPEIYSIENKDFDETYIEDIDID